MIIGILAILTIGALSALTAAIPLFILLIAIDVFIGVTSKLKARNNLIEACLCLTAMPLGTFAGAVAQLAIWQLASGKDSLKWVIAGCIYMIGTFVAMFAAAMVGKTPFTRSLWVNMYALSAMIMFALLAGSYHSQDVFSFLERSPAKVSKFVFGASNK